MYCEFSAQTESRSASWRPARPGCGLLEERPQRLPDALEDQRLRLLVRMDAIGLKVLRLLGESFQQKGQQRDLVALAHVGERALEAAGVVLAVVRRQLHSDEQYARAAFPRVLDDRAEVGLHLAKRQPAQAVVRAEFDDHHRRAVARERGVDAREAAGARLAGDAGVGDAI